MSRALLKSAGFRWVALLGFYALAAAFEIWMRPPGATSNAVSWSVFLGAGPALAVALLGGAGAGISVLFGALFAQALVHGTGSVPLSEQMKMVQGDLIVAASAALQAMVGARLIRARFGLPMVLSGRGGIVLLLLLAGPVTGLVGLLGACVAGLLDKVVATPEVIASGLVGWVAGIGSVFVFLPLVLMHPWSARAMVMWRTTPLPRFSPRAFAYVLVSLAATGGAWAIATEVLARHNRQQFAALAEDASAALRGRIGAYDFGLDSAAALIRASSEVTDGDWRHFVGGLGVSRHMIGVMAIGYAQPVERDHLGAYVAEAKGSGPRDFNVHPEAAHPGPLILVRHAAPAPGLRSRPMGLEGFDLATVPGLAEIASSARDSGHTRLSPRLPPGRITPGENGTGFILLKPVYAPGTPIGSTAERRAAFQGWTFVTFTAERLTEGMNATLDRDLQLALADSPAFGIDASMRKLFFSTGGNTGLLGDPAYRYIRTVTMHGRDWTMIWTSTPAFEMGMHRISPAFVLVGGLAFSVLLAAFLLTTARREELIRNTVAAKTREIARQEAETRSILDTALVMIALLDDAGRILTANDAIGRLFGYHREQLTGMEFTDLLTGETAEYFTRSDNPHDVTGFRGTVHMTARTGERLALDIQIRPWLTADRARRYTVVMRNVAEKLRIEAQLRDTQHRLDIALKGARIGVFDVDLIKGESVVSDTWRDLFGFEPGLDIDTQAEWRARIHPEDRAAVDAADAACIVGEAEQSISDYRVRTMNDEWRWMRSQAVAAERDANGRATRLIGIQMDVTEERMLDQAKSEFVSTVSHELRTPLTSINGSLSLVLNTAEPGAIPERLERLLRIAQKNCDRLIPLVNDILDLEKVSSGQVNFDFTQEDVVALVKRSIADNRPYADQFKVTIALTTEERRAMARLDVNRFLQVMANLLSNAAKFSHRGGRVTVRLSAADAAFRISVTDQGQGIPPAFHDRIFRPFSQADSSATREKGGTGLGLNISKQIVERMGGTIGFRSDPGRETVFWFTIPRAAPREETPAMEEPENDTPPPPNPDRVPLILHVEDDTDFAEIVAASFGEQAQLVHAERHFSLGVLAGEQRFDLVLLDSAQADGADALLVDAVARLQPGVPVIALTASDKADTDPRIARTIIKTRTRFEEIVSICLDTYARAQARTRGDTSPAVSARAGREGKAIG